MKMLRTWVLGILSLVATSVMAADYTIDGQYVTIPVKQVKAEGAKVVGKEPQRDALDIAADTTRIKVDGQAAIDSLNRHVGR